MYLYHGLQRRYVLFEVMCMREATGYSPASLVRRAQRLLLRLVYASLLHTTGVHTTPIRYSSLCVIPSLVSLLTLKNLAYMGLRDGMTIRFKVSQLINSRSDLIRYQQDILHTKPAKNPIVGCIEGCGQGPSTKIIGILLLPFHISF